MTSRPKQIASLVANGLFLIVLLASVPAFAQPEPTSWAALPDGLGWNTDVTRLTRDGGFKWINGDPILGPISRRDERTYGVKEPTAVRFEGKWHLFYTIRSDKRPHQIEQVSFDDWKNAQTSPRHPIALGGAEASAPEVFYFAPQKKWYLICQVDLPDKPGHAAALQPSFSTNDDITKPDAWTAPAPLLEKQPPQIPAWRGFWIICDAIHAHLFITSLDGQLWRMQTALEDFPKGWGRAELAIKGSFQEGPRVYRLAGLRDEEGRGRFIALMEAQDAGRRSYKAWVADRLDGGWWALATTRTNPFASAGNITHPGQRWVDSIAQGEIVRSGYDQSMEIPYHSPRFLFSGISDTTKAGAGYGKVPWRIGMLELAADDKVMR